MRDEGAMPMSRWCEPMAPAMPVPCGCAFSGAPTALKRCTITPCRSGWDASISESITAIGTLVPRTIRCTSEICSFLRMYCAASPGEPVSPREAGAAWNVQHRRGVERGERDGRDEIVDHLRLRGDHRHLLRRRWRCGSDGDGAPGLPREMGIARVGLDAPHAGIETGWQAGDEGG